MDISLMHMDKGAINDDPKLKIKHIERNIWLLEFEGIQNDPEHNIMQAEYFSKKVKEIVGSDESKKTHFLVNATKASASKLASKEARSAYLRLYKMPQIGKVAFVGLGPWLATMIRALTQFAGRWETSRIFQDKEAALAWLQKE